MKFDHRKLLKREVCGGGGMDNRGGGGMDNRGEGGHNRRKCTTPLFLDFRYRSNSIDMLYYGNNME